MHLYACIIGVSYMVVMYSVQAMRVTFASISNGNSCMDWNFDRNTCYHTNYKVINMNKQRREELGEVIDYLSDAYDRLEEIRDDEEDSLYNLPDSLQTSSKGDKIQSYVNAMDNVLEDINKVQNSIQNIIKTK